MAGGRHLGCSLGARCQSRIWGCQEAGTPGASSVSVLTQPPALEKPHCSSARPVGGGRQWGQGKACWGPPVQWSSPASYLPHLPVSASRADMWAVNYLPSPCCEWIQTSYPCPMSSEWENLKTPQGEKKIHMEKTPYRTQPCPQGVYTLGLKWIENRKRQCSPSTFPGPNPCTPPPGSLPWIICSLAPVLSCFLFLIAVTRIMCVHLGPRLPCLCWDASCLP